MKWREEMVRNSEHTLCHEHFRAKYRKVRVFVTRVKRSLSVVNFKRRIASFAWRASSSAFAQRTCPSCIQHCLPLNAPTFAVSGNPSAAFYAAELSPATHNTSRHGRLRPFHVAYGQSQRSMAGPPMRGLINHGSRSKHTFLQIALPLPLPWLSHLCSLTHTLPPLSHNLCSYYHMVTCSFDSYSSFLFSFGSGLGCVTLGLGLGL